MGYLFRTVVRLRGNDGAEYQGSLKGRLKKEKSWN